MKFIDRLMLAVVLVVVTLLFAGFFGARLNWFALVGALLYVVWAWTQTGRNN